VAKAKPAAEVPFDDAVQEHPLFPAMSEDEELPIVQFITITRWDRGRQIWGSTVPASELQTTQDIINLYGGGDYLILARKLSKKGDGSAGVVTKQRRIFLPGKSKSMGGEEEPEHGSSSDAASAVMPTFAAGGAPPDAMTSLLMTMLAQQSQQAAQATAAAQAQQQNFMQMMIAMMGSGKSESAEMTKVMLQMGAQQSQNMMQMMTVLLSNKGGGPEEFAKYAQIIDALKGKGGGGDGEGGGAGGGDIASMLENAADFVQGVVALKGGVGPTLPAGDAPPGSAASVMGGGGS